MYEEFADIMQDLPNESGACDRLDRAEINTISWISEFTLTERNKSVFSLVNSAVNTTLPGACLHWLLNAVLQCCCCCLPAPAVVDLYVLPTWCSAANTPLIRSYDGTSRRTDGHPTVT